MEKFFRQKNKGFTRTPKFGVTPKGGGFTLVETLVAVSIFTISVLALLVVLTQGISNTSYAKQKLIASYLAQEGLEYMRNMRDTFVLFDATDGQTGWTAFNSKLTTVSCATANGCYFKDRTLDYSDNAQPMTNLVVLPCGATCPALMYDASTGKYSTYGDGVDSGIIRKIRTTSISANETKVFSTTSWTQGSGVYSITFSENVFNWAE